MPGISPPPPYSFKDIARWAPSPTPQVSSFDCPYALTLINLPAMLFTTFFYALAAAGTVFSTALPPTHDVSTEKVSQILA